VRKTHEAASEALQDGAGALASPVPSQAELLARLEDSDRDVRRAAVSTLGKLDAATLSQHAPAIVARLEDSEGNVREAAVQGMIGPRYTPADDKQRAFDALVDPGMRDALRVRAQTLLRENPCGLRALQMVNTDQGGLWIHVVLLGEKQRVSCHVLRALQGTEEPLFGRAEWCLPAARPQSIRVDHNVVHFRHIMRRDGIPGSYEEIPGDGEPPPVPLPHASAELQEFLGQFEAMFESTPTIEDLLQWPEEEVWSVIEEFATPDEGCNYRSLGAVDQAPTSREQAREMFIARLARVRAELAQYLPTLRALQVE